MVSHWGPSGALCASFWSWVPNMLWDPNTDPQYTVCSPGAPRTHKWSYSGSCPKSLEDSSWIPFRDHCYTFHMEITLGQKDAMKRCQKGVEGLWWWRGMTRPWKWKRVGSQGCLWEHQNSLEWELCPCTHVQLWSAIISPCC